MLIGSINIPVIPANAGIYAYEWLRSLDSRVRGNDA